MGDGIQGLPHPEQAKRVEGRRVNQQRAAARPEAVKNFELSYGYFWLQGRLDTLANVDTLSD